MGEHAKSIGIGLISAVAGALVVWVVTGFTDRADLGADAEIRAIVQQELEAAKKADSEALGRPVVKVLADHDAKHLLIDERFKNVAAALEATRDIFKAQQKD